MVLPGHKELRLVELCLWGLGRVLHDSSNNCLQRQGYIRCAAECEADRPRYLRTVSLSCPWLHIMNLLQGEWISPTFQFLFSLCIHQGQVLYKEEKSQVSCLPVRWVIGSYHMYRQLLLLHSLGIAALAFTGKNTYSLQSSLTCSFLDSRWEAG